MRGVDIVTAANDQVFETANNPEVAARIQNTHVTGEEPAVGIKALFGGTLVAEIAEHERPTPSTDVAHRAGRHLARGIFDIEHSGLISGAARPRGHQKG